MQRVRQLRMLQGLNPRASSLVRAHVVKPGLISRDIARSFNEVEETRIAADYADQVLQRAEVEAAIHDADAFVQACELMIRNKAP